MLILSGSRGALQRHVQSAPDSGRITDTGWARGRPHRAEPSSLLFLPLLYRCHVTQQPIPVGFGRVQWRCR